jgi:hypothetical protein
MGGDNLELICFGRRYGGVWMEWDGRVSGETFEFLILYGRQAS